MLHVEVFSKNDALKKFENLQENDKSKFYDCKINLTFFLVFFESAILKKRVEKKPAQCFYAWARPRCEGWCKHSEIGQLRWDRQARLHRRCYRRSMGLRNQVRYLFTCSFNKFIETNAFYRLSPASTGRSSTKSTAIWTHVKSFFE